MSVRVVVTFVPKKLTSNVAWGLQNRIWGLPERHGRVLGDDFEWLIITSDVNGLPNGPRASLDLWTERAYVTLNIARRDSAVSTSDLSPLWPDEVDSGVVRYTHRFRIESYCEVVQIQAAELPLELRRAVSLARAKPQYVDVEDSVFEELLKRGGFEGAEAAEVPLSGDAVASSRVPDQHSQGYVSDPRKKKVIEMYAEDAAVDYLTSLGWEDPVRVGKPYDIRFVRGGAEKRVEVKGTTGSGLAVFLTSNEVAHAHANESGLPVDLIVVSEIEVARSVEGDYVASGGKLTHYRDYLPREDDLRATQYEATLSPEVGTVVRL